MSRIAVLVGRKENRRLLAERLRAQHYNVIAPDSPLALDEPYDLGILDTQALNSLWDYVNARTKADRPLFLPFLLLASKQDTEGIQRGWEVVDEFIALPVQEAELLARVRALLRARDLSLDLHNRSTELQAVLDANPDLHYWLDDEDRIVRYHAKDESEFYARPEAFLGHTFMDYLPPGAAASLGAACEHTRATGELSATEYVFDTPSGTRTREARVVSLPENQLLVIVRDITSMRATEHSLHESVSMLRATLDSTADGILAVDSSGGIANFNARFTEMWRLPQHILNSRSDRLVLEFVMDQLVEPQAFLDKVADLYAEPEAESADVLKFKDGRIFERYSRPERLDGKCVGRVWSFRDVTDRIEAIEELRKHTENLARSNAELQQFAYVASHDLQEPLRMVTSYVQLLRKRYQGRLDEDADTFIQFAVDGALRMQKLIGGLLEYSRVGTRAKPFVPVDSEAALSEAVSNLQAAIEEAGAVITHGPLPEVVADAVQLVQLLQNLIANAIKFRGVEPPRIAIRCEGTDGEWVFSVQDNGIGIAPEHQQRVFQVFERLHTEAEYPGTGIGLAVCRRIAERHGGRIWVESEVGKGTTFFFAIRPGPRIAR